MRSVVLVVVFASVAHADTTVTLRDHATDKPLANRPVGLVEPQSCTRGRSGSCGPENPRRIWRRTDKNGTARFSGGEYWQLAEVRVNGYLTRCPHHDFIETEVRHKLWVDSSVDSTRTIECRLVPKSALKVRTAADAIARASELQEIADWRTTHADLKPTATLVGIEWDVVWAVGDSSKRLVYVDALDGFSQVGGRWTD